MLTWKQFILFLLIFNSAYVQAQQNSIDVLKKRLETSSDTGKINILNNLTSELIKKGSPSDLSEAGAYNQTALFY